MTAARSRLLLAVAAFLAAVAPAGAQQDIAIVKRTNGQDANAPPGPVLLVGSAVTWTYEVTNLSGRDLLEVTVTDDQGVAVSCPATTLPAGESMTCTGNGTAVAGQYSNVGTVTAEQQNGTQVSASDPSYYFGQAAPSISLEKATNGFDADTPPGPALPVGNPVTWTYEVTNIGTEPLSDIAVSDDQGVAVSCPATALGPGDSMTCSGAGIVQPGQYANLGSVTATLPDASTTSASDPSHYYGQVLLLEKRTNGIDADDPPGPVLALGAAVTWTYEVINPGPATVTGLTVTDDQIGPITCPQTTLAAGDSTTCTASGTAGPGSYANIGTATAQLPSGFTATVSDASHYFGIPITLEKATNGVDADQPPGPSIAAGDPVSWTYRITNLGDEMLTNVVVTDDQGVTVTCPDTILGAGESMTCTAAGTAIAGQYGNLGTVTAEHPIVGQVSAQDPSHYFGQDQDLDFGDAPGATYLTSFADDGARHVLGSGVFLGACVDAELDGQPSPTADGDDAGASATTFGTCATTGNDEDGVTFLDPLVPVTSAEVEVVASAACTLSAWIDFDGDGDWDEPEEDVFPGGAALAAGSNVLTVAVPAGAVPGTTFGRFRCTTDGPVGLTGEASDGEVEDHALTIVVPALTATKTVALVTDVDGDGEAGAGDTLEYTVTLANTGAVPATGVVFTDTPDANTSLEGGSVTTTAGTVTTGDAEEDTTVEVDVGTLMDGGSATIVYRVTIDDPLPPGTTQIVNQGTVSSDQLPDVLTDDPAAPGGADPTLVALGGAALVTIPTAGTVALVALALLLGALALRRLAAG